MKKRITVKGITLEFSTEVPPMGLAYKNDKGDEAVFTYAKEKQHLFGNIYTADGKTFEIERCQSTHVFREVKSNIYKDRVDDVKLLTQHEHLQSPNYTEDKTTIATFSLMFYYTKSFEEVTPNIEGMVLQALALTNMGFMNSKIPVIAKLFCIEKATGSVYLATKNEELNDFPKMKGSAVQTLSTAH